MGSERNEHLRYYLKTMGCQMNEHDSEVISGLLRSLGYSPTEHVEDADLILYNTCCVRENPERKVYGHMGSFKALKAKKPHLIIGICGCMTQQDDERENIIAKLPHVDLLFGTHNIHRLPELLERAQGGERVVEIWEEAEENIENLPVLRTNKLKAFVNIIYGCTNFCSYCIVPFTRGRERSRHPENIVAEIKTLAEEGYQEVTLLGQNVNAYGKDLGLAYQFSDLLTDLNSIEGLARIRFTTSHPRDMTDASIKAMASLDKVCEHLHLPVQSGSDRLLKQMNRGYSREYYLQLVDKIKREIPGISLTTDLIVGFPGETDDDFEHTLSLVREVGFSAAFTFLYSPRKGTPAAEMTNQIPDQIKKERIYRLIELQNEISAEYMRSLVGSSQEVLVEGKSTDTAEQYLGRTRTNKQIYFAADPNSKSDLLGKIINVSVVGAQTWKLLGKM